MILIPELCRELQIVQIVVIIIQVKLSYMKTD